MSITDIMKKVSSFFEEYIAPPHKITAVEPRQGEDSADGWTVIIEVFEERDYMKKYAKDEMLGVYSVTLNEEAEIESYSRQSTRYRSAVDH
ncbi:gas vesicle protein GvpO [Terribacillus saccharophilus]|uniref:Gas vesicle protein GvpR n=1 Tax=Terribacillus saccharophilus TaxID=361277 RepID=A0A075LPD5_9BACI|nr:gas vesicle protein GvpO [Terribacillus goriensis]AIF67991.1 gas vesicle protein GvpR [Terribacillus goriensis]MEC0282115.1 gas vesicle protein [Terribacillus saccharophilus]MEC0289126.1 gas vesicle protein [Terribacillus saccharophilus]